MLSKTNCTAICEPTTSSLSSPCVALAPSKVAISTIDILGAILLRCKGVPAAMPNKHLKLARDDALLHFNASQIAMKSVCCCRRTRAYKRKEQPSPALVEMATASGLELHNLSAAGADEQTSLTYQQQWSQRRERSHQRQPSTLTGCIRARHLQWRSINVKCFGDSVE